MAILQVTLQGSDVPVFEGLVRPGINASVKATVAHFYPAALNRVDVALALLRSGMLREVQLGDKLTISRQG